MSNILYFCCIVIRSIEQPIKDNSLIKSPYKVIDAIREDEALLKGSENYKTICKPVGDMLVDMGNWITDQLGF